LTGIRTSDFVVLRPANLRNIIDEYWINLKTEAGSKLVPQHIQQYRRYSGSQDQKWTEGIAKDAG
jgi:hypothetical protein